MKNILTIALLALFLSGCLEEPNLTRSQKQQIAMAKKQKKKKTVPQAETLTIIPIDDPRLTYKYAPWEEVITPDGPIRRTASFDFYAQIWHLKVARIEWWANRSTDSGLAGFKILCIDFNPELGANPAYVDKGYEQQELIDLYSPTDGNNIELIKAWDLLADPYVNYTFTIINIGESNPESTGKYISHGYFKVIYY